MSNLAIGVWGKGIGFEKVERLRSSSHCSVGKALANARMAKMKPDGKSMTQKDLATSVNAKPQDVGQLLIRRRLLAAPDP